MSDEDNSDQSDENTFLVAERQHAITVIGSLQRSILRCYCMCPKFYIGHIQDAFGCSFIEQRRPLLIYVHHNDRMPDLFTSDILLEFLGANYVIWPWDISIESNRQILIKIWEEYFSEESSIDFSMDQCPMLIRIMRQISLGQKSFFTYQPEVLLTGDTAVRTNEEFDPEIFWGQLITFNQEFEKNERYLSSDFVRKIVSCPELVFEIAEYLSLNDAASTFSTTILPVLWRYNRKLPVIRPSKEFIETINRSQNHDKILSLRLDESQFKQIMRSATSNTFANVQSLTIFDFQGKREILEMRTHFPILNNLSLHYDGEVDFHQVWKMFELIPPSVKRFEISCHSIKCSHYRLDHLFIRIEKSNKTVESFVLNVDHIAQLIINRCMQAFKKCVLRTITDLIRIMTNIRHVCIITHQSNIETLLDAIEWVALLDICQKLEKITLKGNKPASNEMESIQKIQAIKDELICKRKSIIFEVYMK